MQNHYNQATDPTPKNKLPLYQLICHPGLARNIPELSISVELTANRTRGMLICYTLQGAINLLNIPTAQAATAADGLWQHTCFEAFVGVKGEESYREFNFSPSGQWAAYAFSAYRQRMAWLLKQAPHSQCILSEQQLILRAEIPAIALPKHFTEQTLEIGLTAVIETNDAQLSYWALQHPAEKADFHQRAGFTIIHSPI